MFSSIDVLNFPISSKETLYQSIFPEFMFSFMVKTNSLKVHRCFTPKALKLPAWYLASLRRKESISLPSLALSPFLQILFTIPFH